MTKKYIIIIILVLLILGGGYYYWKTNIQKSPAEKAVNDIQKTADSINQDVIQGVVPSIDSAASSMENLPDANPYSNTNPFKVNPFK